MILSLILLKKENSMNTKVIYDKILDLTITEEELNEFAANLPTRYLFKKDSFGKYFSINLLE